MKSTVQLNDTLRVEHLSVTISGSAVRKQVVHDVSFSVGAGEVLAIVGASGSGKTTMACALTRLLPAKQFSIGGSVHFLGADLLGLSDDGLRAVLRSHIRYIFQEPGQALNPIARIATQAALAFEKQPSFQRRYTELCSTFGLADLPGLSRMFPHELSIGMLQRILLAMALAPRPRLLIADEPTSAIDTLVKYQMMDTLRSLSRDEGLSVVFITHDLALARRYADRTLSMSAGRIGETS